MTWGCSRDLYLQFFSQLSKLQVTTSYIDENMGRVGVKSDTVSMTLTFVVVQVKGLKNYPIPEWHGYFCRKQAPNMWALDNMHISKPHKWVDFSHGYYIWWAIIIAFAGLLQCDTNYGSTMAVSQGYFGVGWFPSLKKE